MTGMIYVDFEPFKLFSEKNGWARMPQQNKAAAGAAWCYKIGGRYVFVGVDSDGSPFLQGKGKSKMKVLVQLCNARAGL